MRAFDLRVGDGVPVPILGLWQAKMVEGEAEIPITLELKHVGT